MKIYLFPIFIIILFSSCNTGKRINYLQTDETTKMDSLYKRSFEEYKIQPHDVLYIRVLSLNEENEHLFNIQSETTSMSSAGSSGMFYIYGYNVSENGTIHFPIIGEITVENKTIKEIRLIISKKLEEFIIDPEVFVKLVSFNISVLGEVNNPGRHTVMAERMNILDAIAMAGDITYYGKRKEINIFRSTNQGTYSVLVDATDRNLLTSEEYYVAPGDIIYIPPSKIGVFRIQASDYAMLLTTLTSTISTILLIFNLSNL